MAWSFLQRLVRAHANGRMVGWDFSCLDGRMTADDPGWDFDAMCTRALSVADAAMDIGTGGGERLIGLCDRLGTGRPARLIATEGWQPNILVARESLEPLGIEVPDYDAERCATMPVETASFDLVMARHEAFDANEVARVLRPGGLLLTQQVHASDASELHDWFGGRPSYPEATLEHDTFAVANAGLMVEEQGEWTGQMQFRDAEALVEYMGLVPWDVPDFTVEPHLTKLTELDAARPITVSQRRYWFAAHKIL